MADKKLLVSYKNLMSRLGYKIIYDGSKPEEDSGVFFVIKIANPDNALEPKYAFYDCFPGSDLSLDGFEHSVVMTGNEENFIKMIDARVKGCSITKSEVICGLLTNGYYIDDIYDKPPRLKLTPAGLKKVSAWVNFQGGLHARKRGEPPKAK